MRIVEIFWKVLKPIIGATLGLIMVKKFNLFSYFSFVPTEEAFNICITVYFALAEIFLEEICVRLVRWIQNQFFSTIDVTLYLPQSNPDTGHNPEIRFNSHDSAEIRIEIHICGKRKHFCNSKMIFRHLSFADIQPNYRSAFVYVEKGDYIINLQQLFGGEEKRTENTHNFKMVLSQCPVDGDTSAKLIPELSMSKCSRIWVHLNNNYVNVRTVNNNGGYN